MTTRSMATTTKVEETATTAPPLPHVASHENNNRRSRRSGEGADADAAAPPLTRPNKAITAGTSTTTTTNSNKHHGSEPAIPKYPYYHHHAHHHAYYQDYHRYYQHYQHYPYHFHHQHRHYRHRPHPQHTQQSRHPEHEINGTTKRTDNHSRLPRAEKEQLHEGDADASNNIWQLPLESFEEAAPAPPHTPVRLTKTTSPVRRKEQQHPHLMSSPLPVRQQPSLDHGHSPASHPYQFHRHPNVHPFPSYFTREGESVAAEVEPRTPGSPRAKDDRRPRLLRHLHASNENPVPATAEHPHSHDCWAAPDTAATALPQDDKDDDKNNNENYGSNDNDDGDDEPPRTGGLTTPVKSRNSLLRSGHSSGPPSSLKKDWNSNKASPSCFLLTNHSFSSFLGLMDDKDNDHTHQDTVKDGRDGATIDVSSLYLPMAETPGRPSSLFTPGRGILLTRLMETPARGCGDFSPLFGSGGEESSPTVVAARTFVPDSPFIQFWKETGAGASGGVPVMASPCRGADNRPAQELMQQYQMSPILASSSSCLMETTDDATAKTTKPIPHPLPLHDDDAKNTHSSDPKKETSPRMARPLLGPSCVQSIFTCSAAAAAAAATPAEEDGQGGDADADEVRCRLWEPPSTKRIAAPKSTASTIEMGGTPPRRTSPSAGSLKIELGSSGTASQQSTLEALNSRLRSRSNISVPPPHTSAVNEASKEPVGIKPAEATTFKSERPHSAAVSKASTPSESSTSLGTKPEPGSRPGSVDHPSSFPCGPGASRYHPAMPPRRGVQYPCYYPRHQHQPLPYPREPNPSTQKPAKNQQHRQTPVKPQHQLKPSAKKQPIPMQQQPVSFASSVENLASKTSPIAKTTTSAANTVAKPTPSPAASAVGAKATPPSGQQVQQWSPSSATTRRVSCADANKPKKDLSKPPPCRCKKSRCLKLYCDCFGAGSMCIPGECKCIDCQNTSGHKEERKAAMADVLAKNPKAFRPRVDAAPATAGVHNLGCRCSKTGCLKKYCECFKGGILCGPKCKCAGCNNRAGSQRLIDARRKMKDSEGAKFAMQAAHEVWCSGRSSSAARSQPTQSAAKKISPPLTQHAYFTHPQYHQQPYPGLPLQITPEARLQYDRQYQEYTRQHRHRHQYPQPSRYQHAALATTKALAAFSATRSASKLHPSLRAVPTMTPSPTGGTKPVLTTLKRGVHQIQQTLQAPTLAPLSNKRHKPEYANDENLEYFSRRLPSLPNKVAVHIFSFLELQDLQEAKLVCKIWKHLVKANERMRASSRKTPALTSA